MEQDHATAQPRGGWLGPGTVVDGRFRLASVVARTGSDAIYSAVDERTRQRVRLRVTAHEPDPALVKLRHPAIPSVLHQGRAGRWHYVVLEWFDGEPVQLPTVGPIEPPRVRHWANTAMDLLDALEHLHVTSGRAHGSLSVDSLWVGVDGRIRILDVSAPDGPLGEEVVPYASPERLRGLPREPRSDLYSMACLLHALATGLPPFGLDPIEARSGHLLRRMHEPTVRSGEPVLPPMFVAVLRTALEKQPLHRFASAARMRAAFGLALRDFESGTANPAVLDTVIPDAPSALAADLAPSITAVTPALDEVSPEDETAVRRRPDLPLPADEAEALDDLAPMDTLRPAMERELSPELTPVTSDALIDAPSDPATEDRETEIVRRVRHELAAEALSPDDVPTEPPSEPPLAFVEPEPRRKPNQLVWALVVASTVAVLAMIAAWVAFAATLGVIAAFGPGSSGVTLPPLSEPAAVDAAPLADGTADVEPAVEPSDAEPAEAEPVDAEPAAEPADDAQAAQAAAPPTQNVPIDFPYNSYDPVEGATFPEFVALVRGYDGSVRLTGHTDDRGPAEANLILGLGRAWAVQQLLRLRGIEEQKVPIASKGETEPVADNATAEGRAQNRRVTAEFLEPAPKIAPGTPAEP
ncbi:MAG: OmpA family protein [Myxococcota bacterium]